jgi:hypothetical protein
MSDDVGDEIDEIERAAIVRRALLTTETHRKEEIRRLRAALQSVKQTIDKALDSA